MKEKKHTYNGVCFINAKSNNKEKQHVVLEF